MKKKYFVALILSLAINYSSATEDKKENNPDKQITDFKIDDSFIDYHKTEIETVTLQKVGIEKFSFVSKNLAFNVTVSFDENTFKEETNLSIFSIEKDIGLESYKILSPLWWINFDKKMHQKTKYTFEYEKELDMEDADIIVLTYWNGEWILAGIPVIERESGRVSINVNYSGWFVVARIKSRDEIRIRKYTFTDNDKKRLFIAGIFCYETMCRKGEDLLEEKLELIENFSGDITFSPIENNRRTGIKVLSAEAIGNPVVLSFQSRVYIADKKETVYGTSYEIPKQRGIISAQNKNDKLIFGGMPTLIVIKGIFEKKEVLLPMMREKISLSGVSFDWKLQEMFHLKNFTYKMEMTMPHGTEGEQTRLIVYLQFIVK